MNNLLKQITKGILVLLMLTCANADNLVGFYEIPKQHKYISSSITSQLEGENKKEWLKVSSMERELDVMVKNLQKRQVKNVLKDPDGKKCSVASEACSKCNVTSWLRKKDLRNKQPKLLNYKRNSKLLSKAKLKPTI